MSRQSKSLTNALACAIWIAAFAAAFTPPRSARSAEREVSFKAEVLPLFDQHCVTCHSPSGVGYKAVGLDLRSYKGLMAGSTMGGTVVRFHPEESQLIAVLTGNKHAFENLKMPPSGPLLSSAQVQTISLWIKQGAKDN